MTEKEIKELAREYINGCTKKAGFVILAEGIISDFIDLFVAGFMKCLEQKENKPKWHDLRKDPTDIPPKKDDIYSIEVWAKDARGHYGTAIFSYACFEDNGKYNNWIGIIPVLWTELPKFEEEN